MLKFVTDVAKQLFFSKTVKSTLHFLPPALLVGNIPENFEMKSKLATMKLTLTADQKKQLEAMYGKNRD